MKDEKFIKLSFSQIFFALLLFLRPWNGFSEEIRQPAAPTAPVSPEITEPASPASRQTQPKNSSPPPPVPAAPDLFQARPQVPSRPNLPQTRPSARRGSGEGVRETENYFLTVTAAYSGGNTKISTASAIDKVQCIKYSDESISLGIFFKNSSKYTYYLRNPGAALQISPGTYRRSYDTVIQTGGEFLPGIFISEVLYNENSLTGITLIGENTVIVTMNFIKP